MKITFYTLLEIYVIRVWFFLSALTARILFLLDAMLRSLYHIIDGKAKKNIIPRFQLVSV